MKELYFTARIQDCLHTTLTTQFEGRNLTVITAKCTKDYEKIIVARNFQILGMSVSASFSVSFC